MTISDEQHAYFKVSGTHAIYLTGNYVIPADNGHNHQHGVDDSEDDEDYDFSPDEDELDDLEDPRITELASEDDEVPKLTKKSEPVKKGKNKRAAEESDEEPTNIDDIIAKSLKPAKPATNGEPKLSKKQLKKLKNNAGKAVEATLENKNAKKEDGGSKDSSASKSDKKVQFAKNLEQGPSGTTKETKSDSKTEAKVDSKKDEEKPKASLGLKTIQGVKIDDKKLGKGPAAKKGDKVGMRYIGKLTDGKVFDGMRFHPIFLHSMGESILIYHFQQIKRAALLPLSLALARSSRAGISVLLACQ